VPVIGVVGEQKTKPTQHSVAVLRSLGLHPHLLACRCAEPLDAGARAKLALFCQVPQESVLTMHDVSNLWRVPLLMQAQGAHETVCRVLGLGAQVSGRLDMRRWKADIADRWDALETPVRIALIGKYTGLSDAYLSVVKSLQHACLAANLRLVLDWVDAAHLEEVPPGGQGGADGGGGGAAAEAMTAAAGGGGGGGSSGGGAGSAADKHAAAWATVRAAQGILVPGGFGTRGTEGKIAAARYARENKVPYLGVCLGMQLAVVEFARSVLGIADADSAEFTPATAHPAVVFMPEISTEHMGGTMRLGARRTVLQTMRCATAKLYAREVDVSERHRHRYEVNPALVPRLEAAGMRFVGKDESGERMEILELEDNPSGHPFYVAAQFHPEVRERERRLFFLSIGLRLFWQGATGGARGKSKRAAAPFGRPLLYLRIEIDQQPTQPDTTPHPHPPRSYTPNQTCPNSKQKHNETKQNRQTTVQDAPGQAAAAVPRLCAGGGRKAGRLPAGARDALGLGAADAHQGGAGGAARAERERGGAAARGRAAGGRRRRRRRAGVKRREGARATRGTREGCRRRHRDVCPIPLSALPSPPTKTTEQTLPWKSFSSPPPPPSPVRRRRRGALPHLVAALLFFPTSCNKHIPVDLRVGYCMHARGVECHVRHCRLRALALSHHCTKLPHLSTTAPSRVCRRPPPAHASANPPAATAHARCCCCCC